VVEVLDKVREMLGDMRGRERLVSETWRNSWLKFAEAQEELERRRLDYFRAHEILDGGVASYEQCKLQKGVSADKKKILKQRISLLLRDCKSTDKTYTNKLYDAKNARIEYIKTAVYSAVTSS